MFICNLTLNVVVVAFLEDGCMFSWPADGYKWTGFPGVLADI